MKINLSLVTLTGGILPLAGPVEARMYQWISANSGLTQLSGRPPSWYRSDNSGPRVFVFENGTLVDDTGVVVELQLQIALRVQAFRLADEEGRALALERERREEALLADTEVEHGNDYDQMAVTKVPGGDSETTEQDEAAQTQATMDRLRAVVNTWDLLRTEEARALLQNVTP